MGFARPLAAGVITQGFGSRAIDYSDYGLIAHNGVDFVGGDGLARAMAPGVVERIGWDPGGYGNYVTLRHAWVLGHYRTRYCHLASIVVGMDQRVVAGQVLGRVGATGHVTGVHLHAEFEPGYACADGLKGRRAFVHMLEGGTMRLGWHLGNEGPVTDLDWEILKAVKPGYVTLLPDYAMHSQPISHDDVAKILEIRPDCHFILRPYLPGTAVATGIAEYANAVDALLGEWSDWVPEGQKHLQLFNEPNMPRWTAQWEGFGDQLEDMRRYNDTWVGLVERLRMRYPDWLFGWGPLTIGNRDMWFPGDAEGHYYLHGPVGCHQSMTVAQLDEAIRTGPCYESLMLADEYYSHGYIHEGRANYANPAYGLRHERASLFFPRPLPIVINEAGYPNVGNWPDWAGDALIDWLNLLYARRNVEGVCLWILGEHWEGLWYQNGAVRSEVWRLADWQAQHPEQPLTDAEIDAIIGTRLQEHVLPLNPEAAFEKAAALRGLLPASRECDVTVAGTTYRAQVYRAPEERDWQHIVYCVLGDWGNLRWFDRLN